MSYHVCCFDGFEQLPGRYEALLDRARSEGLYSQREWFELLARHRYTKGQAIRVYTVERADSGDPLLMLPLYVSRNDRAARGAYTFASIVHFENYAPVSIVCDPSVEDSRREVLGALFRWLAESHEGQVPRRADVIRLAPLVADSPMGEDILEALRDAGFAAQIYENSYNQFEETEGISYEDYLARRSSNQRYNSRRRRRKLEQQGVVEFAMITSADDPEALRDAIDEYILVAVRSWKSQDSTIAPLILEWMDIAAELGYLRLGILRLDGRAIAAQFWVSSGGVANLVRTNFREDFRDLAPGVVLSNLVIEYLLDEDKVASLDFGYGNEEYKGRWVDEARIYRGIMAFNPSTIRGYYFGHKHILGQPLKRVLQRGRVALHTRGSV